MPKLACTFLQAFFLLFENALSFSDQNNPCYLGALTDNEGFFNFFVFHSYTFLLYLHIHNNLTRVFTSVYVCE